MITISRRLWMIGLLWVFLSCGPIENWPTGRYWGEVLTPDQGSSVCEIYLEPTGPHRLHLHLEYNPNILTNGDWEFTGADGEGLFMNSEWDFMPDSGGMLHWNGQVLRGMFFSASGRPYCIEVEQIPGAITVVSSN
jgi:hypothetical protein